MSNNDSDNGKSTGYRNEQTLRRMYWGERMSLSEIADHFDVVISTIERWMKKNDVERRSDGRRYPFQTHASYRIDDMGYGQWRHKYKGKERSVRVHQLLAVAEGEDPHEIFGGENHVHHKNGVRWDNRPENIELLTATGHTSEHHIGEKNANAKLSETDVGEIKQRLRAGESVGSVASDYPVVHDVIEKIGRGSAWGHVE